MGFGSCASQYLKGSASKKITHNQLELGPASF